MTMHWDWKPGHARVIATVFLLCMASPLPGIAQAASGQKSFPTPAAAATALMAAVRAGDSDQLLSILGPDGKDLISSGDPVADKQAQQKFAQNYDKKHSLSHAAQGVVTLVVGADDWPLPIPLVRDGVTWYFDSARGRDEILNRRVGTNELGAIAVCEGFVRAQQEYAAKRHDGLPSGIFAQKLVSDEGKQNGLYWKPQPGQAASPFGPAIAAAAAEGYGAGPAPYHGYFYKLLKEQGPAAPGGAKNYLVDGKLSGGFALLAYPANYGNSGIMTFLVNRDGTVLQKDLGDDTLKLARQITAYNPDDGWANAE